MEPQLIKVRNDRMTTEELKHLLSKFCDEHKEEFVLDESGLYVPRSGKDDDGFQGHLQRQARD